MVFSDNGTEPEWTPNLRVAGRVCCPAEPESELRRTINQPPHVGRHSLFSHINLPSKTLLPAENWSSAQVASPVQREREKAQRLEGTCRHLHFISGVDLFSISLVLSPQSLHQKVGLIYHYAVLAQLLLLDDSDFCPTLVSKRRLYLRVTLTCVGMFLLDCTVYSLRTQVPVSISIFYIELGVPRAKPSALRRISKF